MIIIKKIIWIDEDIGEADVVLTDGKYEISCFGHPFFQSEGDKLDGNISALDYKNIIRSNMQRESIKDLGNWNYLFTGRVLNHSKGIVQVGGFEFYYMDNIPKDIKDGEWIEFVAERLDI